MQKILTWDCWLLLHKFRSKVSSSVLFFYFVLACKYLSSSLSVRLLFWKIRSWINSVCFVSTKCRPLSQLRVGLSVSNHLMDLMNQFKKYTTGLAEFLDGSVQYEHWSEWCECCQKEDSKDPHFGSTAMNISSRESELWPHIAWPTIGRRRKSAKLLAEKFNITLLNNSCRHIDGIDSKHFWGPLKTHTSYVQPKSKPIGIIFVAGI